MRDKSNWLVSERSNNYRREVNGVFTFLTLHRYLRKMHLLVGGNNSMAKAKPTATPPYMSTGVFKNTVDAFVDSTVPTAFDRHVLSNLSGADYSSLISGLRFLGLVDASSTSVKAEYRALVDARKKSEDAYKAALRAIVEKAYKPIVGGIDTQHGTLSQLEKAFRDAGVDPGQMMTKTVRFYVKTLADCGVEVSPHITKPRRATNGLKKPGATKQPRTKNRRGTLIAQTRDSNRKEIPAGFGQLPIPGLDGAFIQYPANLTENDFALFEAMVGVLRTYVKGRAGRKERKS